MATQSATKERTKSRVKEPKQFNVIMHNDDFTTMEFVVSILIDIFHKDEVTADSLASEVIKQHYSGTSNKKDEVPIAVGRQKVELFNFDPNTADSITLHRLGLPRWQVRSIYKYRAHGGVYRCKEDFAQLRGLTLKKYRELEPYIHIADQFRPASEFIHRPGYHTTVSHSVESTEVTSSSQGESGGTP